MKAHTTPFLATEIGGQAPTSATIGTGRLSLVVALYFLMLALPIQFNLGPIFMTGVRVIFLITTIPLTIRLFSGGLGRVLLTDVLLIIYLCWAIVTLSVNSPSSVVSIGGAYALEVFGSYVLARNYIRTPEQFRAMCRGLFSVLIFSLPFAIYETQTGNALLLTTISKIPGIYDHVDYFDPTEGRRLGLYRSQVIFSHPIHYGLFCASLLSLAVVGFSGLIRNYKRYLLGALISIGVIASVSSGAILPVIMQLALMAWAFILKGLATRWSILVVFVLFCYFVVDLISSRSAIEVFLSYMALSSGTSYGRIIIFEWGMKSVWSNPFFGIGLNDWERPYWLPESVDNFWLLVAMRYGMPGFFLVAWSYLALVWRVMRRDFGHAGSVWQFRRAWIFVQISMILMLCTVDVWDVALSYMFFLLGAGAWMASGQALVFDTESVNFLSDGKAKNRYTRFSQTKRTS